MGRQDRLIHYVRKQIHAESNNTHIELVRRVAEFWYSGDLELLSKIVPGTSWKPSMCGGSISWASTI